jgi:hypothetical protein
MDACQEFQDKRPLLDQHLSRNLTDKCFGANSRIVVEQFLDKTILECKRQRSGREKVCFDYAKGGKKEKSIKVWLI